MLKTNTTVVIVLWFLFSLSLSDPGLFNFTKCEATLHCSIALSMAPDLYVCKFPITFEIVLKMLGGLALKKNYAFKVAGIPHLFPQQEVQTKQQTKVVPAKPVKKVQEESSEEDSSSSEEAAPGNNPKFCLSNITPVLIFLNIIAANSYPQDATLSSSNLCKVYFSSPMIR